MTLFINGMTNTDYSFSFCVIPPPKVLSYFPNPVSPVLRTDIVFTLDYIPDQALNAADYSIYVESVNNPGFMRYPVI